MVANRRRVAALVYVGRSRARGRPRSGYMDIVMAAAREAGLPPCYVRNLARLGTAWASRADMRGRPSNGG